MKRILVLALSLAAICGYAQKVQPEEIPWMVERNESPEWYARQAEAWEEVVARWYRLCYADKDVVDSTDIRRKLGTILMTKNVVYLQLNDNFVKVMDKAK